MKKILFSLGLVAMMLNLTNCAQYEDVDSVVEPQGDFALYASVSRTANDGVNTVWVADDEINVFHAEAGTTNYLNDTPYLNNAGTPFVCKDAANGYFLGTLNGGQLDATKSYDWYAFYPYESYIATPANDSRGYAYIGGSSNGSQTQNGNNSMAHIAGKNYPMAGYAKGVAADKQPEVVFNHIASLIEFEVINGLQEAIKVSEINFTAGEDIVGSYYINFADYDDMKFTPSGDTYISNTASLSVVGGEAIEAGKSAKFYMAVKPFTAAKDSELKVSVAATSVANGGNGTHEKTITLGAANSFDAGKLKNVKVNYTTAIEAPAEGEKIATLSFASKDQRTSFSTAEQVWEQNGIVFTNKKTAESSNVADYAAPARCYKSSSIEVTAPGKILNIVFDTNTYKDYTTALTTSIGTVSGATVSVSVDKVTVTYSTPVDKVSIAKLEDQVRLDALTVTYIAGGSDTPDTPAAPELTVTPEAINGLSHESASSEFSYSVTNPVEGTEVVISDNADWLTTADNNGTVTVTAEANNVEEIRTATITVTYGNLVKTVSVQQNAKPTVVGENEVVDVLDRAWTGNTETSYASWSGKTSNSTAVYAGNSAGGNSSIQLKSKDSSSGIITTTSGGKARNIVVTWNSNTSSGRTLDIYGKDTAYSEVSDLYDSSKQGTKIGSIVCGSSTTSTISGDYAYIGLRSNSGAMYLEEIKITWETGEGSGETPETPETPATPEWGTVTAPAEVAAAGGSTSISYSVTNAVKDKTATATTTADWITNFTYTADKVTFDVAANTGAAREATVTLSYEGITETKDVTVKQAEGEVVEPEEPGSGTETLITTLTNANIAAQYNSSSTSYRNITLTDSNNYSYNAYAILKQHSNATSTYKHLQIKAGETYFIQIPDVGVAISKIEMVVSSSQKAMDGGGNTATLYFSESKKSSNAVGNGTGKSNVTISMPNNTLKSGYILASGAVRIWEIKIYGVK